MDYYQTHDEIDEIGEGLIRKYQYQSFIQGTPTDIEDFITSNLGYRIVYDRIAEGDAGKIRHGGDADCKDINGSPDAIQYHLWRMEKTSWKGRTYRKETECDRRRADDDDR